MRKWLMVGLFLVLLPLLGACDYHELDNTVFVVGMGIERAGGDGYLMSAEIITMEKGDVETFTPQIATATGKTVLEATSNIRGIIAQRLDFSHCQVIVIDEAVAQTGIEELVDTILQFNEIDINTFCMVSVGCTPLDVLSTEALTTRAQSFELRSTLVDEVGIRRAERTTLLTLYANRMDMEQASFLPILRNTAVRDKSIIELSGIAVIQDNKMVGKFSHDESFFLLLTESLVFHRTISVPLENTYFPIQVEKSKVKIDARFINGEVEVSVLIRTQINYIGGFSKDTNLNELLNYITVYFHDGVTQALAKSRDELDCDVFKIAQLLYRRYPGERARASDWRESVRNARYSIQVTLDIQTDEIIPGGK